MAAETSNIKLPWCASGVQNALQEVVFMDASLKLAQECINNYKNSTA